MLYWSCDKESINIIAGGGNRIMSSKDNLIRTVHIDIFRSFGIILMVMGHIGFGVQFDHFIHAFHMPMFFFISGMFFRAKSNPSLVAFVKKKAKSLLVPYVVFGLFHYLIWSVQNWPERSLEPLWCLFFINTDGLPIAGALWFLTAIFLTEVIYFLVRYYIKNIVIQNIVVILIALIGCLATTILPFRLPYALDAAFVGVGLIHIGNLFQKKIQHAFELKYYKWLIFGIITTVQIFLNGYINMRTGQYAIIPLFWLNAVLAVIVGINFAKYTMRIITPIMKEIYTFIGRNSIVYLCLNQLIISCTSKLIYLIKLPTLVSRLIIFALSMLVLHGCAYILINTKFKWVIGK